MLRPTQIFVSGLVIGTFVATSALAATDGRSASSTLPRPRQVEAESEFKPHVGIMAGVADLNGASMTGPAFLLDVGFQPYVPFGLSAQFQYQPGEIEVPGDDIDFNTTNVLMKGSYNFGGSTPVIQHAYIGAKTGLVIYSGDIDSEMNFAIGPVIGADIPVTSEANLTLGGEATYLGVLGDVSPDQLSLLGAMKYWF